MPRASKVNPDEKSKDFIGAIKRLISEIHGGLLGLLIVSIIFSIVGAVISVSSPQYLSKITDTISDGVTPNLDALGEVSQAAGANLRAIKLDKIRQSAADKAQENPQLASELNNFVDIMERTKNLDLSPDKESDAGDPKIQQAKQKIAFTALENLSPDAIEIILPDITVRDQKISSASQAKFFSMAHEYSQNTEANQVVPVSTAAEKIDELPEDIRNLVLPKIDIARIKKIASFWAFLLISYTLVSFIDNLAMTQVTNIFAKQLRERISRKINRLPLKYFDQNQTGDILSRVTNDIDTVSQSLNDSLASVVWAIALFIGTLFMMLKTNWIMSITAIIASLIGFALSFGVLSKSQKYFAMRQKELGKLNAHIEEAYSGLNVIKAYNGRQEVDQKFDHYNKRVFEANRKSQFLSGLMNPLMTFVGNLGYVAVCIVGAILTQKGMISFGVIIAFISYVRLFNDPLTQIAQSATSLQSAAAASERVFEFLDAKEMEPQDKVSAKLDKNEVKGDIEFRNVKFGYNEDRLIVKNFSAKAKAGQKIAIVGPTGAGKTTLVNLLMKFYEINDGKILIDGVETSKLSRENIHDLFTMVLQDTWMFEGSLRDNIIYNKHKVSDKQLNAVCEEIGLSHFIKTLPHGLDTEMGENDDVSAGQKQLITIARGMIKDSPFLILDEATSNVDTRTEELVQSAMDKLMQGRTSFIIAHRLSTIKNADLILVMKDGNIIESGNHNQLMKEKGFYADLYNSQFVLS